jgi:hypothetical protein
MGVPGFTPVPHDLAIEADESYPDYRFFLQSPRGLEPISLAPGKPHRIDGQGRHGINRIAYVIAVPHSLLEQKGESNLAAELKANKSVPGILWSEMIAFRTDVPFFDSRDRVIDRYRVELNAPDNLRLVWLAQNEGSRWVKGAWAAGGICVSGSIIWFGWWATRRVRRSWSSTGSQFAGDQREKRCQ